MFCYNFVFDSEAGVLKIDKSLTMATKVTKKSLVAKSLSKKNENLLAGNAITKRKSLVAISKLPIDDLQKNLKEKVKRPAIVSELQEKSKPLVAINAQPKPMIKTKGKLSENKKGKKLVVVMPPKTMDASSEICFKISPKMKPKDTKKSKEAATELSGTVKRKMVPNNTENITNAMNGKKSKLKDAEKLLSLLNDLPKTKRKEKLTVLEEINEELPKEKVTAKKVLPSNTLKPLKGETNLLKKQSKKAKDTIPLKSDGKIIKVAAKKEKLSKNIAPKLLQSLVEDQLSMNEPKLALKRMETSKIPNDLKLSEKV